MNLLERRDKTLAVNIRTCCIIKVDSGNWPDLPVWALQLHETWYAHKGRSQKPPLFPPVVSLCDPTVNVAVSDNKEMPRALAAPLEHTRYLCSIGPDVIGLEERSAKGSQQSYLSSLTPLSHAFLFDFRSFNLTNFRLCAQIGGSCDTHVPWQRSRLRIGRCIGNLLGGAIITACRWWQVHLSSPAYSDGTNYSIRYLENGPKTEVCLQWARPPGGSLLLTGRIVSSWPRGQVWQHWNCCTRHALVTVRFHHVNAAPGPTDCSFSILI